VTKIVQLPTGDKYQVIEGVPRRDTVYPEGFAAPAAEPQKISDGLFTERFEDTEDERTAFTMFCWAFDTLVKDEILNEDGSLGSKPPRVIRVAIGEPGNKVRIATKSEAALVTYGQPWGHCMKAILEFDPNLKAGLSSGFQGFEWIKMSKRLQLLTVPKWIMTGDFTEATDHIVHEHARLAFRKILDALGSTSRYLTSYLDLLASPREVVPSKDDIIDGPFITQRGILMGEPGAKSILTLLTKIANRLTGSTGSFFATAGDDQIDADDRLKNLITYRDKIHHTTLVPGDWAVSPYAVKYCEEILIPGGSVEPDRPDSAKLDCVKLRLCSPEQKTGRGDQDTNPAYGKARELTKQAFWAEHGWHANKVMLLFLRNMQYYLAKTDSVFLPTVWGGLGLELVKPVDLWAGITPAHKALIVERDVHGDRKAANLLTRWATSDNLSRGLVVEESSAYDTYVELIEEYTSKCDLEDIPLKAPAGERRFALKKLARKAGWETVHSTANQILSSQRWQEYWNPNTDVNRGYKRGRPMFQRDNDLNIAATSYLGKQKIEDADYELCPKRTWPGEKYVNVRAEFPHTDMNDNLSFLPLIGSTESSPRAFLKFNLREMLNPS